MSRFPDFQKLPASSLLLDELLDPSLTHLLTYPRIKCIARRQENIITHADLTLIQEYENTHIQYIGIDGFCNAFV